MHFLTPGTFVGPNSEVLKPKDQIMPWLSDWFYSLSLIESQNCRPNMVCLFMSGLPYRSYILYRKRLELSIRDNFGDAHIGFESRSWAGSSANPASIMSIEIPSLSTHHGNCKSLASPTGHTRCRKHFVMDCRVSWLVRTPPSSAAAWGSARCLQSSFVSVALISPDNPF